MDSHLGSSDLNGSAARVHRRHTGRRHRRFHVRPEALGLGNYRSEEAGQVDPEVEPISWGSLGRIALYILIVLLVIDVLMRIVRVF